jgi:hypothetical protein
MGLEDFCQRHQIRYQQINDEYYFCLADIGRSVGWKSAAKDYVKTYPAGVKMLIKIQTSGGMQDVVHFNFDGLRRIICRCRVPKASQLAVELGIDLLKYRVTSAEEETIKVIQKVFLGEMMQTQKQVSNITLTTVQPVTYYITRLGHTLLTCISMSTISWLNVTRMPITVAKSRTSCGKRTSAQNYPVTGFGTNQTKRAFVYMMS